MKKVMADINDKDILKIGIITSTHGIKGEVKVYPTTDDVKRFKKLLKVILKTAKEELWLEVENVKFFKQFAILKFKGYDSINDIEEYKNAELYVERKDAVKLSADEYFIADLIGMDALSDDGIYKGIITDVLSGNANDVYEITLEDGTSVLIPAIKECIKKVDPDSNCLTFTMMKGLI